MIRLRTLGSLAVLLCLAPACSKNDVANAPVAEDSGSTNGDGDVTFDSAISTTDTGTSSDGTTADGTIDDSTMMDGSADGTATDGAPTDGTTPTDSAMTDATSTDTADTSVASVCPKAYSDVTPTAVTYPGPIQDSLLAAITWDELTMVWTTQSAGKVVVHYADRASRDAAFTSDQLLPDSLGPFAEDKVGLTADGLTMMFVSADHKTVKQITRTARGAAFDSGSATTAPFANITGGGGSEGGSPAQLADLTLSKDGKWLFYTDLLVTSGSSMRLTTRLSDGTWDIPTPITATRLQMDTGLRRRPTGISSDKRALFFYDEPLKATFVAFRAGDTALFTEFYGYSPTGRRAMPADACDRVYLDIAVPEPIPDGGVPDGPPPKPESIFHAP